MRSQSYFSVLIVYRNVLLTVEMEEFIGLPLDVSNHIMSGWFTIVDIAKLDTAICARKHRVPFLTLLAAENMILPNIAVNQHCSLIGFHCAG